MQETSCSLENISRPISPEIKYPYPLYKMEDERIKNKLKQNQVGNLKICAKLITYFVWNIVYKSKNNLLI